MQRPGYKPLKRGDDAPCVLQLQIALMFFQVKNLPAVLRAHFGANTEDGVKELQRRWELPETGIAGEDFFIAMREHGLEFDLGIKGLKPHAPIYLARKLHLEETVGIPLEQQWILSPGRRFRLRGDRIWQICKVEDGSVEAMTEGDLPDVIHFNRNAFLREIEEELAPAEPEA